MAHIPALRPRFALLPVWDKVDVVDHRNGQNLLNVSQVNCRNPAPATWPKYAAIAPLRFARSASEYTH